MSLRALWRSASGSPLSYGCHSRPIVLQVALDSRRQDVETDDIGNCDEYHEAVDEIDDLLYIKYRPGDHRHAEKYTIRIHRQA